MLTLKYWKKIYFTIQKRVSFAGICASPLFILFFSYALQAQVNRTELIGIIIDYASKQPVEFANIQLLRNTDKSIAKSAVTDSKGKFIFEKVPSDDYMLICTFIGYAKKNTNLSIGPDQQITDVGTIEISLLTANMADVSVYSRTSMLNTSIDRKIYNVSQDVMAQSGTASDMLKNIPSVEVDIDGLVSLRGSQKVMILINGKPSTLTGKRGPEVLQQLPANSIEHIEVITNPSAQYQPDGTAGIINIVLKKSIKGGWNGFTTANIGNNDRYNGTISLNYKSGKFNFFGTYSIRKDTRIRLTDIEKMFMDSTQNIISYNTQHLRSASNPLSHSITVGADYSLSVHNSFGFSNMYVNKKMTKRDVQNEVFYDHNKIMINGYDRLRHDPEHKIEDNVSFYWLHNFKRQGRGLRVEFNALSSTEKEDNQYTNIYQVDARPPSFDNTINKLSDDQQQLSINYSNSINKSSKMETGYLGSFSQQDFNFLGEYFNVSLARFIQDVERTNQFLNNTSIHAFYSTYRGSYKKVGYIAGLRAEQVFQKQNLVTKDLLMNNGYFKVYPTVHILYKLKSSEIQLNYSKRVNRPEGEDLNPFPKYRDPRNLSAGNPALLPEVVHSVELGYKWQNNYFSFVPGLYYRYKQNGFTQMVVPVNDSVLLTTTQNLSNEQSSGIELIFSLKAGNLFSANLTSNFFYNQIDASDLGYNNKRSIYSMGTNFNSTFSITKTTKLQVTCNYGSARLTPQGKLYPNLVLNTGIRQDLFKKKWSCSLTTSDLLNSLQQKMQLNTSFLKQASVAKRNSRIIYFGMNYRFGKVIKKAEEEKLKFDNSL